MAKMKRLIFKVDNLEKKYGSISALDLKKLDIHPDGYPTFLSLMHLLIHISFQDYQP